jgi:hypothetical protein
MNPFLTKPLTMRWQLTHSTSEHEIYNLYNDNKKLLTLELNIFSNTARVHYNNEKRVFVIRKEGLRRNKTVIRNEYGIKIGELSHEPNNKDSLMVSLGLFFGQSLSQTDLANSSSEGSLAAMSNSTV